MSAAVAGVLAFGSMTAKSQTQTADLDEDFDLNIIERHITETNFERSLQAQLNTDSVRLQVGVSAEAETIDLILRGVTGHVRFRASLERVRQRIARLRSELNSR